MAFPTQFANLTNATGAQLDGNFNALNANTGASLVGFLQSGTGTVARTVQLKQTDIVSVKDFGAVGDGVTDDTASINTAISSTVANNKSLYFPPGTYISSNISAVASMALIGAGVTQTIIKLKNGTNAGLVNSASNNIDDVYIAHIRFDGNSANNTAGDVLTIKGCRSTFFDIEVINAPANGIITDWNIANSGRLTGCEGFYSHITIDSSQKSGWIHNAPSDSHFESVIIIDAGLQTNNTYYGLFLNAGPGNGRFFNCHIWNRDVTTNTPIAACYVGSSGNNFCGCHFEGGNLALNIAGNGNTFASCAAYAPRSTFTVGLTGSTNTIELALGLTFASSNTAYKGINLASSNNNLILNNAGSGCTLGIVDFTLDAGENIIKIVGFQSTGTVYNGTPNVSDEVTIMVSGAAGLVFQQYPGIAWTQTAPTPTSGTGALTTASAILRIRQIEKQVNFAAKITITTNGTGATSINLPLPITANAATTYTASGRADAVSGKQLQAKITGNTLTIFNYDNTYPGASGEILYITGTYEAA